MPCSIRQRCGHRAPCEPPAQRAHLKRCGRLKPRQYGRSMRCGPAGWESVLRFAFAPTCTRALFALLTPLAFLAFLAERFLSELFADPAMPLPFGGRAVSAAAAAERRFWGFLGATTEGRGALDVRFASSNERIFACLAKGWCSFCIVLRLW